MTDSAAHRVVFYKAFLFMVAYLVVLGWTLSGLHHLRWIGVLSLPGLAAAGLAVRRQPGGITGLGRSLISPLAYWPFLLVVGLALLGQLIYPPTMLDSLTYRLPRLFIWLQDNGLQHVLAGEDRLDYMPHTWGLATLPLVQLAGDQLVCGWTFGSWLILYLLAYDWALEAGSDKKQSQLMAFLASTSLFAVLQGGSTANDLFAGVMALLALRLVMNFEQTRNWREICWSVLSFCIAAGTKPHFAVFGLPLTLWFFFSPAKPWRAFRWAWLPVLLVVWLLCSPAPSFLMNCNTYGNWAGSNQVEPGKSRGWNMVLGTAMIAWQNPQPPVNPAATATLNRRLSQAAADSGLAQLVPRFNIHAHPITLVDGAGLGLVTSVLFGAGIFMAVRRNPAAWRSWRMMALAAGAICTLLALSRFVPSACGRAYCGFLYFALPLALAGWNRMRPAMLKWGMYLSLFSSLTVVILNPSHPLWPARRVQQELARRPQFQHLAEQMNPYVQFSERANTGRELMQAIPADESQVMVLAGGDRPLLALFRPYSQKRQLLFLPMHAAPDKLIQNGARYVVVGGGAAEVYPELCDYLAKSGDYALVMEQVYTSKLARGSEVWQLFLRKGATNSPAQH